MNELWAEYEQGGRDLFALAHKLTNDIDKARDLVQAAMFKATRSWGTFKRGERVGPWLRVILKRIYYDERKSAAFRLTVQLASNSLSVVDWRDGPAREAERRDTGQRVRQALGRLPAVHSDVLRTVVMDGASYKAAALMLRVPLGTIKSRFVRAKEALRAELV